MRDRGRGEDEQVGKEDEVEEKEEELNLVGGGHKEKEQEEHSTHTPAATAATSESPLSSDNEWDESLLEPLRCVQETQSLITPSASLLVHPLPSSSSLSPSPPLSLPPSLPLPLPPSHTATLPSLASVWLAPPPSLTRSRVTRSRETWTSAWDKGGQTCWPSTSRLWLTGRSTAARGRDRSSSPSGRGGEGDGGRGGSSVTGLTLVAEEGVGRGGGRLGSGEQGRGARETSGAEASQGERRGL